MRNEKTVYIAFITFCLALGAYLFISGGSSSQANSGKPGRGAAGNGRELAFNSGSGTRPREGGKSVFENQSFPIPGIVDESPQDSGKSGKSGDEPELLDPADKDNPINPQTGKPYSNSVMKRFESLQKRFPNNSIIPRKKTPEDIAREKQEKMNMYALQSQVTMGKASPEDVQKFYQLRTRSVRDRIELLEYVMDQYKGKMDESVMKQYEKILQMNRRTLASFQDAEKRALDRAQNQ